MNRSGLFSIIKKKRSFLCIGLDSDSKKIPEHLLKCEDPVFEFNKQIIEATHDLCVAYKPNLAFYEVDGVNGLRSLEKTMKVFPENIFTIADAKRGDIGNTSELYARSYFDHYGFDALTVAPYMGSDSVKPFLGYKNKWVILLALTSNEGAADFQLRDVIGQPSGRQGGGNPPERSDRSGRAGKLFEEVLRTSQKWGNADSMMYVVGATRAEHLSLIRKIVPEHFLLIPGVGAQGGSLADVAKYGMNKQCGLLVNASRSILFASSGKDFAEKAREEAMKLRDEMSALLEKYC
ncbi:MAG: orotidine-5'-phosphate decarboxylase [Bacteroidetes bacterium]|nr:orotidine-5'-phosphate decarboxylase [Bacteroidota bacterium]